MSFRFIKEVYRMSAQLDALNAAVAKVQSDVTAAVAKITALQAEIGNGIDPVAVQSAADALTAAASQLETATTP